MLKRKHLILILLTPVAVIADQVTKTIAQEALHSRRNITIIADYFDFVLVKNRGMVFGLFNDIDTAWRIPLFAGISVVAIFIIIHLFRQAKGSSVFLPTSLALILSGAMGNLIDRFRWGYVVDFINLHYQDKHYWPTFNLADTAITMGIAILIIDTFFTPAEKPENESTEREAEESLPGEDTEESG